MNFKEGQQVKDLHFFIKSIGLAEAEKLMFFASAKLLHEKPNVIFDVTLDEVKKIKALSYYAELGGYDRKNVNVVWVLTDVNVAKKQNQSRSRTIPEDLLVSTHEGAAMTMMELMANSEKYSQYIDGDIWIVFNTAGVDSRVIASLSQGLDGKSPKHVLHLDPNVGADGKRGYIAI